MFKQIISFSILLLLAATSIQYSTPTGEKVYRYENGWWFNGQDFVKKEMYVKSGMFIAAPNNAADSVIDLQDMYIIPPFAEAHTHFLEGIGDVDSRIKKYLRDGVFYVKNPNNVLEWTKTIYSKVNTPQSLDASFANAGITGPGGHPEAVYEVNIRQHMKEAIGDLEKGWFKNKAYYQAANANELERLWPKVLEGKPDFIKIYLSNTGVKDAAARKLRTGIAPEIAALVVSKAHKAGLRVTAHVETAADFREAVKLKVDEINHTPGYYIISKDLIGDYILNESDARLAAKNNIYVVTALLSRDLLDDRSLLPDVKKVQAQNLQLLYNNGVKLAIGSDHAMSPADEMKALDELNILDAKTKLKIWCESTPLTIFPNRKIGLLKEGYEASFLGLSGNPLLDWKQAGAIKMRIKKGNPIIVN
ncbi:MAG: amidohydrolase family protein [Chitinophagaceae bacterium]